MSTDAEQTDGRRCTMRKAISYGRTA